MNFKVLESLIKKASNTEFGINHRFAQIESYDDFKSLVPVSDYQDYIGYISRIKDGQPDILWPGETHYFAVTSGTTSVGKHIPITYDRIKSDKEYQKQLIGKILIEQFSYKLLSSNHLSIPGSLEEIPDRDKIKIGEISGITAFHTSSITKLFQKTPPQDLVHLPWKMKYDQIVEIALNSDIRSITGAPTWIIQIMKDVIKRSGKPLHEQWPNLKLVVSGGVALSTYLNELKSLTSSQAISFYEMYGASEAYLGIGKLNKLAHFNWFENTGLFVELMNENDKNDIIPHWMAIPGQIYLPIITSNTGLWRYKLTDRIQVISNKEFKLLGRAGLISDVYGEQVEFSDCKRILKDISNNMNLISIAACNSQLHLLTKIEFESKKDLRKLSLQVDQELCKSNRHYAIRRKTNTLHIIKLVEWNHEIEEKYISLSPPRGQFKIKPIWDKSLSKQILEL